MKSATWSLASAALAIATLTASAVAQVATGFEPPDFALGSVAGQEGWVSQSPSIIISGTQPHSGTQHIRLAHSSELPGDVWCISPTSLGRSSTTSLWFNTNSLNNTFKISAKDGSVPSWQVTIGAGGAFVEHHGGGGYLAPSIVTPGEYHQLTVAVDRSDRSTNYLLDGTLFYHQVAGQFPANTTNKLELFLENPSPGAVVDVDDLMLVRDFPPLIINPTGGTVLSQEGDSDVWYGPRPMGLTASIFGAPMTEMAVNTNGKAAFPAVPATLLALNAPFHVYAGDRVIEKAEPGQYYSVTWDCRLAAYDNHLHTFQAVVFAAPMTISRIDFQPDDIVFCYGRVDGLPDGASAGLSGPHFLAIPGNDDTLVDNNERSLLPLFGSSHQVVLYRSDGTGSYTRSIYPVRLATCSADFDGDGDQGTDADIEAFFACLGGACCPTCTPDFDDDGDQGTDADIESFFRVIGGGEC